MKHRALPAGEPHWKAAGVRKKINLLIGPAIKTLRDMLAVSRAALANSSLGAYGLQDTPNGAPKWV